MCYQPPNLPWCCQLPSFVSSIASLPIVVSRTTFVLGTVRPTVSLPGVVSLTTSIQVLAASQPVVEVMSNPQPPHLMLLDTQHNTHCRQSHSPFLGDVGFSLPSRCFHIHILSPLRCQHYSHHLLHWCQPHSLSSRQCQLRSLPFRPCYLYSLLPPR